MFQNSKELKAPPPTTVIFVKQTGYLIKKLLKLDLWKLIQQNLFDATSILTDSYSLIIKKAKLFKLKKKKKCTSCATKENFLNSLVILNYEQFT